MDKINSHFYQLTVSITFLLMIVALLFNPVHSIGKTLENPTAETTKFLCQAGVNLNIVAHEDDDILFMNPDIQHDISAGECVTTIYVTTGAYAAGTRLTELRENGPKAAYAEMAGSPNIWMQSRTQAGSYTLLTYSLRNDPKIKLIFMRLPNAQGSNKGWSFYNGQTLQDLYQDKLQKIKAVDGTAIYSRAELIDTFTFLMNVLRPSVIRVQDYLEPYGFGDHSDHVTVAKFVENANSQVFYPHSLIAYHDYDIAMMPANLTNNDLKMKEEAWDAYASFDPEVCQSAAICKQARSLLYKWITGEYIANIISNT